MQPKPKAACLGGNQGTSGTLGGGGAAGYTATAAGSVAATTTTAAAAAATAATTAKCPRRFTGALHLHPAGEPQQERQLLHTCAMQAMHLINWVGNVCACWLGHDDEE